ncbi:hypothetical protein JCM10207_008959 [Rhodosporidiobolus poonsookiae]
MARGHQKIEAQKKNAAKAAANKGGTSQLKTRAAGLKLSCSVCKNPISDLKNYRDHFEAKHPKNTMPSEEEIMAAAAK